MGSIKLKSLCAVCLALGIANEAIAQRGPAVVETVQIIEKEIVPTQLTLGSIMPTRRAVIGSAVDGRVDEFFVREGARVSEGQKLAKLLTSTIESEIDAAEAELELREHELEELTNGSRPEEILQAKARMEAIAVAAQYLEKDKQRLAALGESSAISLAELEKSLSLWLEAQQKLIEAESAYQLAVDGPRPEKIKQAEARKAMASAVVEKLRDQFTKHTMISRFEGYVAVEHTEVGQWVARGEPVAEIIALDEVFLIAKVVETHIPFIKIGEVVDIEVPALGNRKMSGAVEAIVPSADERSRTFPVKIRVKNQFTRVEKKSDSDKDKSNTDKDDNSSFDVPDLKAGMLAHAKLPIGEKHRALLVPKDALVLNGAEKMIWKIDPKSIEAKGTAMEANAIAVAVQTGTETDELIEVIGKVSDEVTSGIEVVIRGNERIPPSRPGQPSRVMWNPKPAIQQK